MMLPKESRRFITTLRNKLDPWSKGILAEMEKLEEWKNSYGPPSKSNIERALVAAHQQALFNLYKRMKDYL